jgi:membrane-associated phospholipid phosphatase
MFSACSTVTAKGYWGAGVGWPDGQRLRDSAVAAARSPYTWAPLAGALVLGITDLDQEISEWAVEETPLFGDNAADASDRLKDVTTWSYVLTALAAPSDSLASKAKGFGVGLSTMLIEQGTVKVVKSLSNRERPDGSDDLSFPSGHTSRASSNAAMAAANLDYMKMPGWARVSLQVGVYAAAAGTGWARVEAQKHYPSDVLVGFAVGQFLARFMYGAFMDANEPTGSSPSLSYTPLPAGGLITMTVPLR